MTDSAQIEAAPRAGLHEDPCEKQEAIEAKGQTKNSVLAGSYWVSVTEVVVSILDVARQWVTVRVLLPEDIGLMGTAMLMISVLDTLTKTGFDRALIQRKEGVAGLMNVVWTLQIVRGLVLAAILAVAAPFLARTYELPVLAPLLWVTCLHAFLPGLQNVGLLYYTRNSDFKTLFLIGSMSPLVRACVVIPLVIILKDVWALMIGLIAATATWVIVSFVAHPYRPKLEWDWEKTKELFKFGKWITGLSVMYFFVLQGDALFVSKYMGPAALAIYVFSMDMATLATTKVSTVLGTVTFPTYARLQSNPAEMRALFQDVVRATMLVVGPVTVLLFAIAPDVVNYALNGEVWAKAIPIVRILVVAGWLRAFTGLVGPLFQAVDRADLDFKMNLIRFGLTVLLVWPACKYWGLEGVAWLALLSMIPCLPIWFFGVKKIIGVTVWQVIRSNTLAWVATGALAATYFLSRWVLHGNRVLDLASSVVALGAWAGIMHLLGKYTRLSVVEEVQRLRIALKAR